MGNSDSQELIRIDCLGDMCPVPVMRLKQHARELSEGKRIMLITDHSCVSESVKNYCKVLHYDVEVLEPINGVWEFYISRREK